MKRKLFIPLLALLAFTISIVIACQKGQVGSENNVNTEGLTADGAFKSNEWPTFVLMKEQLKGLFVGDFAGKDLLVVIKSDMSKPKSSMELQAISEHSGTQVLLQDPNKKAILNAKLAMGNSLISLSGLAAISQVNGDWVKDFSYIRFIPVESSQYRGYLTYKYVSCDKDGRVLQVLTTEDSAEGKPSPPACGDCPPGYYCNSNSVCVLNP